MIAATEITRDGKPVFIDRLRVDGGGSMLGSPAGLHGAPVTAMFVAACETLDANHVAQCREVEAPAHGEGAITRLPVTPQRVKELLGRQPSSLSSPGSTGRSSNRKP